MPSNDAPFVKNEPLTMVVRLLAIVGVAAKFSHYEWSLTNRPDGEVLYTFVAVAAGICLLRFVTPRATKLLLRHRDLLVPFGCYLLATEALAWLPLQHAAVFYSSPTLAPSIFLPAMMMLVASLIITTTFAVWQTLLITQAVTSDGTNLVGELRHALTILPRGLAIVTVAYAAIMGPFLMSLWGGLAGGELFFYQLFGWAIYCLAVGVVTCLWLPMALDVETPFWESLGQATSYGIHNWRANATIIVPWAAASGFITLRYITSYGGNTTESSWNVQPKWYGDYLFESAWYGKAAVGDAPELIWIAVPLAVLFAATSITVKATLIQRLDNEALGSPADVQHPPTHDS